MGKGHRSSRRKSYSRRMGDIRQRKGGPDIKPILDAPNLTTDTYESGFETIGDLTEGVSQSFGPSETPRSAPHPDSLTGGAKERFS